jgi:1,4-alpha-glucan branching enzyme
MPRAGRWIEKINSDALAYGGTGLGNGGSVMAVVKEIAGQPAEAIVTLPPMATLILEFSAT